MQLCTNFVLVKVKHRMTSYISIFFVEGSGCQKNQVSALRHNLGASLLCYFLTFDVLYFLYSLPYSFFLHCGFSSIAIFTYLLSLLLFLSLLYRSLLSVKFFHTLPFIVFLFLYGMVVLPFSSFLVSCGFLCASSLLFPKSLWSGNLMPLTALCTDLFCV